MRITHVMLSTGWGGAERLVVDLCGAQAELGNRIQLVCRARFPKQHLLDKVPGVTVSPVPAVGNLDWVSVFLMLKVVRGFRPDLLNTHMARGTWMGGWVGRMLGVPVLTTIHNYIKPKYCRNVEWFHVTTGDQKRHLIENGFNELRIYRIPNFSTFPPVSHVLKRDNSSPVFVSYGRFEKKKGFSCLLEAFRKYLDSGYKGSLLLGGNGPEKQRLTSLIERLGLSDRVFLTGWVENVQEFLAKGDVCVIPSLHEPFGIVCLEAMACGIPIVASRSEGPSEILDEDTAYLCEVGDSDSMYESMREASLNPEHCRSRASAALERYKTTYTKEAVVPLLMKNYERILFDKSS